MLTDREEIEKWLKSYNITGYYIHPNGVVDVDNSVDLNECRCDSLLVHFGSINGSFYFQNDSSVLSFEGFPHIVRGHIICHTSRIRSMSGLYKVIKLIRGGIVCHKETTHILGLLTIPGLISLDVDSDNGDSINRIMNKYIGTGDILSAQDELIDAGFIDQARL
jgi:hypothetical protein